MNTFRQFVKSQPFDLSLREEKSATSVTTSNRHVVLRPHPLAAMGDNFEHECVYNPAAIEKNGKIHLLYRAEDKYGEYVSSIALATSDDGVKFQRHSGNPVITPETKEEQRGCEDPRITYLDGKYYLFYTAFDGDEVNVSMAVSEDLVNWKKEGVVVADTKSFALFPQKINGRFAGLVGDKNVSLAYSDDLIDWKIEKKPLLRPRPNSFDSHLVETGPPPFLHNGKWHVIYNSSDKTSYNVGLCVLEKNDLGVIHRSEKPFFSPRESWEKFGKVNNVVFATGLASINNKLMLYYGGADKVVGVTEISIS